MKITTTNLSSKAQCVTRRAYGPALLASFISLFAVLAQAQITYTPVFTNVWELPGGSHADLPGVIVPGTNNNVRGLAINPVTTNLLYASTLNGTNNGVNHIATVSFASGSNYLAGLNGSGFSGGTLALVGVRVADDGAVYGYNLSGGSVSTFKLYRWPSDSDTDTAPTAVATVAGPSFTWRIGDYADLRGGGINTEIVVVGNGSAAAITTNFVIFRPTDPSCTSFTNFSITIPVGLLNVCGGGVAFEGTNNAIWVRQSGSQNTRRVAYDPATLTATVTRTNTVDQSTCQGLKYFSSTNGVQLLATVQASTATNGVQRARVFQIPATVGTPFSSVLNVPLPAPANGNLNGIGNVDVQNGYFGFGAPNNGISLFKLDFVTTAPPTVTASSSGSPVIAGYPVTLTAAVSGSSPFGYQWYFNTNTLIPGATTNVYNLASTQTTNSGVYTLITTNLYGKATNSLSITVLPNGSSLLATQIWSLAPGSRDYVTTGDAQRGLAYDSVSNVLVLVSSSPTNGIHLLDAATGTDVGDLNVTGIAGGARLLNMCGVADDGAVYVGNLITGAGDAFTIYRWSEASSSATLSYAYGDSVTPQPGYGRIGDTMSVRGAGVNTEILCSFRTGTNVALFNTTDGFTFTFNLISVTNLPADAQANGFAGLGIAFGTGNTFWAKSSGFNLRQLDFDITSGTAGVFQSFDGLPAAEAPLAIDNANAYVALVAFGENPQNLPIYDLNAPSLGSLLDRELFGSNNANLNGTGAVAFDVAGGRLFALDSNNGLLALTYAPRLYITPEGQGGILTWTGPGALLSSTNVAGPYSPVPGATSPYTNTVPSEIYFRVQR